MFDVETLAAISRLAKDLGCQPAALQAVAEVESNGQVFALVNGRNEPLIRWEGHYFDARLTGAERALARKQGLASPRAGAVKNPASQAERWKLLTRATQINKQAALESFSIGLGQVMTAHWKRLGFDHVQDMIALARSSAGGQIEIMARFIDKSGLADDLRRLDFTAFARGYNGPAYARNAYNTKMAAAYRHMAGAAPVSAAQGMLRMGSSGARVRDLQTLLVRAGYAVTVDGDYGPATRDAVKDFQKAQKIVSDGVAGPETMRRLEAWKQAPQEQPGAQSIAQLPETKQGIGGLIGGGAVETVRQQIEGAASQIGGVPALEWISTVLTVLAALLALGGLAWMLWGWMKSKRTDEGDVQAGITPQPTLDEALG